MHNSHSQPREFAPLIIFVVVALLSTYIVFLVASIPFKQGMTEGVVEATYARPWEEKKEEEAEVFDHSDLIEADEELIKLGKAIYGNNCKSCHGDEGLGNGPSGMNLAVKPRNFHQDENWLNGKSAFQMYQTLENGVGQGMAAFPSLNPKQKYAVIHYIHDSFMQENGWPEPTEEELSQLPAPAADTGGVNIDPYTDDRVPVRYAMEKLLLEE